ncbi:MAG TPA: DUF6152 family protein [Steroidobacteraceae bacterium]|jgi:hypothetical protein|nr:DUF6152 family protein [Steroidobacteraceae bacterium]
MNIPFRSLLAGAALACTLPAAAHHSFTMFDVQKQTTLTGTVKEFQWSNPHCWIQLMVDEEGGQQAEWSVELASPRVIFEGGWKPGSVKPGDKVTITMHPLKDGSKGGSLMFALGPDGQRIGKAASAAPAAAVKP